jgi:hypothetical protein
LSKTFASIVSSLALLDRTCKTSDTFLTCLLSRLASDFTFGEISRELQDKQKLDPIFLQAKIILEQAH